ncbi:MAG: hypothetical protein K2X03_09930 [Bryobacteraceae bacterium]|nr:hypothetical protein [Bryobacteraceae bacterium]
MQRAVSILLLALFSFALSAPAWPTNPETKLPPCCRRDGKHGCGMKMKPASAGVAWRANSACAQYGQPGSLPAASETLTPPAQASISLPSLPSAVAAPAEVRARISFHRARQKRGPPTFLS